MEFPFDAYAVLKSVASTVEDNDVAVIHGDQLSRVHHQIMD